MTLSFDQAVEEEKKKNILKGLPEAGFNTSTKPISTIMPPQDFKENRIPVVQRDGIQSAAMLNKQNLAAQGTKINELPNVQRDSELGKMNVSTEGTTTTYNIGGNTLSYDSSQKDTPVKTNLERINSQSDRPQPTWDDYHKQQKAKYDAYVNAPRGRFFGVTPLESKENNLSGLLTPENSPGMGWRTRQELNQQILANQQSGKNTLAQIEAEQNTEQNKSAIDKEANRINELGTISQNKLRDIQGQVAQDPPDKESLLKPMVVEEPDPTDPLGERKRQRIMIPNPDGTGYIDGMSSQPALTTPKPATTEKLLKMRAAKDPNFAAAEAEYKMRFGSLPY